LISFTQDSIERGLIKSKSSNKKPSWNNNKKNNKEITKSQNFEKTINLFKAVNHHQMSPVAILMIKNKQLPIKKESQSWKKGEDSDKKSKSITKSKTTRTQRKLSWGPIYQNNLQNLTQRERQAEYSQKEVSKVSRAKWYSIRTLKAKMEWIYQSQTTNQKLQKSQVSILTTLGTNNKVKKLAWGEVSEILQKKEMIKLKN
jgi:hypothetical protein